MNSNLPETAVLLAPWPAWCSAKTAKPVWRTAKDAGTTKPARWTWWVAMVVMVSWV